MAIKVSGTTVIDDARALQNITDIPNLAKAISIEAPANGSTDTATGRYLTIDVSPYLAIFGVSSALEVQLDNNSDMSSPFYDEETTTSGSEISIDSTVHSIPVGTTIYVRARYKDTDGAFGSYSPISSFTSRASFDYPNQPSITSASSGLDINPTFTSSAFSTTGGSTTHTSSSWQVAQDATFNSIIDQGVELSGNLTSWGPGSALNYSSTYYVRVKHHSSTLGDSDWSASQTITTGLAPGEEVYTTPGTYSWVPTNDVNCSAVAVGGGGGGVGPVHDNCGAAGGACSWINNFSATGGQGYTVTVGAGGSVGTSGGNSSFNGNATCYAGGGYAAPGSGNGANSAALYNTARFGDGGGDGGGLNNGSRSGAGVAGGYTGQGGVGQETDTNPTNNPATGGGGGAGFNINNFGAWAGGGVGIFGEGTSGASGTTNSGAGKGGSGGAGGLPSGSGRHNQIPNGGAYGGGAGSAGTGGYGTVPPNGGQGGGGAVRIMWGGGRTFPNNADAV